MIVEIISVNGQLMYLHPLLETLVLAPEGSKLGQRIEVPVKFHDVPIPWEDRPKL